MNDKFKIIDLEKKLIVSFDKNLSNFPHKEIELKSEIISTTYNMLKTTLEANASFDAKKRENIQDSIIASIKYLNIELEIRN